MALDFIPLQHLGMSALGQKRTLGGGAFYVRFTPESRHVWAHVTRQHDHGAGLVRCAAARSGQGGVARPGGIGAVSTGRVAVSAQATITEP